MSELKTDVDSQGKGVLVDQLGRPIWLTGASAELWLDQPYWYGTWDYSVALAVARAFAGIGANLIPVAIFTPWILDKDGGRTTPWTPPVDYPYPFDWNQVQQQIDDWEAACEVAGVYTYFRIQPQGGFGTPWLDATERIATRGPPYYTNYDKWLGRNVADAREEWLYSLKYLADRYKNLAHFLGMYLWLEPDDGALQYMGVDLPTFWKSAVDAIHTAAPNKIGIVPGWGIGSLAAFPYLSGGRPYPNTMYYFHRYFSYDCWLAGEFPYVHDYKPPNMGNYNTMKASFQHAADCIARGGVVICGEQGWNGENCTGTDFGSFPGAGGAPYECGDNWRIAMNHWLQIEREIGIHYSNLDAFSDNSTGVLANYDKGYGELDGMYYDSRGDIWKHYLGGFPSGRSYMVSSAPQGITFNRRKLI